MRLLIVLAILGFGLAVLVVNHDAGQSFGMANDDFGDFIRLLPFAAMLSVGLIATRRSIGESARQLAVWMLITLALVTGYLYRLELQAIGNRLLAGLIPGRAVVVTTSEGRPEVILHKSLGGHFETTVDINGVAVPALIDTGASTVALSFRDAVRVGIDPADLAFTQTIMTANGRAMAAPVRLRQVGVGPILRENIQGSVIEDGKLDQSLLGMSFLSTLGSLQMQSDELRLRD